MKGLTIGQLAKEARVKVETVRYYERRGLIAKPPRRKSGYRQFPLEAVQRIRFIKRAQNLGFTLKEISQLLALADGDRSSCQDVHEFTMEKIAEVETQIRHLQSLKRALENVAKICPGQGSLSECPIIETLLGEVSE